MQCGGGILQLPTMHGVAFWIPHALSRFNSTRHTCVCISTCMLYAHSPCHHVQVPIMTGAPSPMDALPYVLTRASLLHH